MDCLPSSGSLVRQLLAGEWLLLAPAAPPRGKVTWRVKDSRNDLRIRLHGAPVERDKTGLERGKYQHPELYGQPPEMGMDYHAEHEGLAAPAVPEAARRK